MTTRVPEKTDFDKKQFLISAFSGIRKIPSPSLVQGPHFNALMSVYLEVKSRLTEIDPRLPVGLTKNVLSMEERTIYDKLDPAKKTAIDQLRLYREQLLRRVVTEEIIPFCSSQTLPQDTLSHPETYYQQRNKRTCAIANFCSLFEEITGESLDEEEILAVARDKGLISQEEISGEVISKDILLKIFNSQAFKENFPVLNVKTVHLTGLDFEYLKNLINRLKQAGVRVYCMLTIESEIAKGGWHDVILLEADENSVTINDPSTLVGGQKRKIPKQEFLERWGETYLSGDLIIVQ
ncbi:hypothetical protein M0P48_00480 [Candidatus Gracilibacteria bacterium]|jgi:hypothetical protein|nr:hypothetical protein [Candidatus Gracilibacteria bacterium]